MQCSKQIGKAACGWERQIAVWALPRGIDALFRFRISECKGCMALPSFSSMATDWHLARLPARVNTGSHPLRQNSVAGCYVY